MSNNPINLAVRFILELCALASAAYWGAHICSGVFSWLIIIFTLIVMAGVWGVFRTPNEPPPANPKAPVPVKGVIRLFIELVFFGFAVWCLFYLDKTNLGIIFLVSVIVHYLVSYDRIYWLIKH